MPISSISRLLPLFQTGALLVTPAAHKAIAEAGQQASHFLIRHWSCDWAAMDELDRCANAEALARGGRIYSTFSLADGTRLWVITEADRSVTAVVLPSEY